LEFIDDVLDGDVYSTKNITDFYWYNDEMTEMEIQKRIKHEIIGEILQQNGEIENRILEIKNIMRIELGLQPLTINLNKALNNTIEVAEPDIVIDPYHTRLAVTEHRVGIQKEIHRQKYYREST
jgi:hypothetical protein